MKRSDGKTVDTRLVAENCSQFSPVAAMTAGTDTVRTCEICKKWDGKKCSVGLYNVIAKNLKSFK